ncbi:MAG: hypothetical protein KGI89_17380, partial [Euryarchaeota archaeon]|nr:hypothetical protein [Euryarchaeota archaeon]
NWARDARKTSGSERSYNIGQVDARAEVAWQYGPRRLGTRISDVGAHVERYARNPDRTLIGDKCICVETTKGKMSGNFGAAYGLPDGTAFISGVFTRVPEGYVTSIAYIAPAKTKAEEPYFRKAGLVKPGQAVDYDRPWRHEMTGMHVVARRVKGGLHLRSEKGLPLWKRLPHKTVVQGQ